MNDLKVWRRALLCGCLVAISLPLGARTAMGQAPATAYVRMVEWTIESHKVYADPFNDVDVDVIFERKGSRWRVPTFWRGGHRWTVRFAPPLPGEYAYRLESTDRGNPDLNGHAGRVQITAYTGSNELLRHGAFRVSADRHHLEYGDGSPFFWLGDAWYSGLSDRLSWGGFQELTANRKAKGFTVAALAVMTCTNDEQAPTDPGFCNEGGCIWDPKYQRINPRYFDFADRRIQHLVNSGIAPVLFGAWHPTLAQMGLQKMKQHWRYIIARYGAYPVFWIVGGEINDPPPGVRTYKDWPVHPNVLPGGWTEVARYIRVTDPYRRLLSVHEGITAYPLQDPKLVDFDYVQPAHNSWPSIAFEVAEVTTRYARAMKPVVVGEMGMEGLGGWQLEDFQRLAYWLAMLNGAAGYTYGTTEIADANSADKPLHRGRYSLFTWREAMNFPGSSIIALNSHLIQQYPWNRLVPHPEWVVPRGTTLLDPTVELPDVGLDMVEPLMRVLQDSPLATENDVPIGEWQRQHGTFRWPYAAGIAGELRLIYSPSFGVQTPDPPTILGLERGIRYHAYLWDPRLGVKFDLGAIERPTPGRTISQGHASDLEVAQGARGRQSAGDIVSLAKGVNEANPVATVDIGTDAQVALVLRYQDPDNYTAATYSPREHAIFLQQRLQGRDGEKLGYVSIPALGRNACLSAQLRDEHGIVSLSDGQQTYTSPIVALTVALDPKNGHPEARVGLRYEANNEEPVRQFEISASPALPVDEHLERKLYDAHGEFRGELSGVPEWAEFGKRKLILLDAYRPERFPYPGDWALVLERDTGVSKSLSK